MKNSVEFHSDVVHNARTLKRMTEYPGKARKHRYERRKVRNFIGLTPWDEEELL